MEFAYNEDQEEFRRSVRAFFEHHLPHAQLPAMIEREEAGTGLWEPMAGQLGLPGLAIAEEHGGGGYGMVELALVLEEAGRALVPEPLFATLLGTVTLGIAGDEAADQPVLPAVANGEHRLAVAVTDAEDAVEAGRGNDGSWRLNGTKLRVLAAQLSDSLLVFASTEHGPALFQVDTEAASIEPVQSLDATRPQARVVFDGAGATLIGGAGDGGRIGGELDSAGGLMLAAEQVGGAERCLEMAVDHAKERRQFGRPIGSFQAVKHHCANMLIRVEAARTAVMYAAWAWDAGADDRIVSAAVAKAAASDAYWENARTCIQVLGGIGFTQEHPAQLHFKRATASAQMFGSAAARREQLAKHILEAPAVVA
jgi:alkylation response protein AidB-like acyl-CoA dehydrogenase